MKRLFTLIVAISAIFAAMAQYPMATLSRNGELTQFTGLHALDEALNASEIGDIVYLSEGTFASERGSHEIKYGVSVVGCGYNTKILGNLGVMMVEGSYEITMDSPLIDGVNINNLGFRHELEIDGNREYMEIRNCWIGNLNWVGHAAKNVYINSCSIEEANFSGIIDKYIKNVFVNNSKIRRLLGGSEYITITNCNIQATENCPRVVDSCIIAGSTRDEGKLPTWDNGTHFINNSLFPSEDFVSEGQDVTTLTNCYYENPANGLLDENLNCTIDLASKGYLGQDGTVVGAYGGENPFSEYPSVPTIDSAKSSVEYDAA